MRLTLNFNDLNRRQMIFASVLTLVIISGLFTYITTLLAFISPSQELRWNTSISSINKQTFQKGETVTIMGFLEEGTEYFSKGNYYYFTASEDIVWFVNVLDPNNQPIYFRTPVSVAGASGDISTGNISFPLPSNAVAGTYRIRLIVWTDLLPGGETRTYLVNEAEFEVSP